MDFLEMIRRLFGSAFDKLFPTWTPIVKDQSAFNPNHTYTRPKPSMWSEAAKAAGEAAVFQYDIFVNDSNGRQIIKTVFLSKADLRFLKEVQDDIKDYTEYLFMKRKKQLIREAEEASKAAAVPTGENSWKIIELKPEDLNRIDKYHDYRTEP